MAYGARLESVLGESPRGFESPILRREKAPSYLVFRTTGVDHRASMCSAICAQLRIL